jgi:hypothetical protein
MADPKPSPCPTCGGENLTAVKVMYGDGRRVITYRRNDCGDEFADTRPVVSRSA